MFDTELRGVKDRKLELLTGVWVEKVTPNQITFAAFIIGLLIPVLLYFGYNLTAFLVWIFNRVLDGLDGLIARKRQMKSDLGGYFDILTDFVIYALIPMSIALREGDEKLYILTIILIAVFYINSASWMYLSGILEKRKKNNISKTLTSLEMPRGIIEGGETILFYSLFMLMPGIIFFLMAGMAVLTTVGIPQRIIFARKNL